MNLSTETKQKETQLLLSNLSISVVLDHAGGHDSEVCRRELFSKCARDDSSPVVDSDVCYRELFSKDTRGGTSLFGDSEICRREFLFNRSQDDSPPPPPSPPLVVETNTSPFHSPERRVQANDEIEKLLLTSPTKKHNKKHYIGLKDRNLESKQALLSKPKRATKRICETTVKSAPEPTQSPIMSKAHHVVSLTRIRRRNSTGSIPVELKSTQPKKDEVIARIRHSRRLSLRNREIDRHDKLTTVNAIQAIEATLHKESRFTLTDSPTPRRSRRSPKGYQALIATGGSEATVAFTNNVATSETSCSTHSSLLGVVSANNPCADKAEKHLSTSPPHIDSEEKTIK